MKLKLPLLLVFLCYSYLLQAKSRDGVSLSMEGGPVQHDSMWYSTNSEVSLPPEKVVETPPPPVNPTNYSITGTNVTCKGLNNGSITLTISSGVPMLWEWFDSQGVLLSAHTNQIYNLSPGTYTLKMTERDLSFTTQSVTINEPATPLDASLILSHNQCYGLSTGRAEAQVTGGKQPYVYTWESSTEKSDIMINLSSGSHHVTITDSYGCTITKDFDIYPTAPVTTKITTTDVSCKDGSTGTVLLESSGGTPPYAYYSNQWLSSWSSSNIINNLKAGGYSVQVRDFHNCPSSLSFTINEPATALTLAVVSTDLTRPNGGDGTATITANGGVGGYTYAWNSISGNSNTATALNAGTYMAFAYDANGCSAMSSFTINDPGPLTAEILSQTHPTCMGKQDGAATVKARGGAAPYTYLWSTSDETGPSATHLAAGLNTVTITDRDGTSVAQDFFIFPTAPPIFAETNTSDVTKVGGADGSATITCIGGTPGYSYAWSPSGGTAATATGLSVGVYTVLVTDANGCTLSENVTINLTPPLTISNSSSTNVTCNGKNDGSATVEVSGGTPGYTYRWSPGGATTPTATGLAAGDYTVTITDAGGNSIEKTFHIITENPLVITSATTTNISCAGGSNGSIAIIVESSTPDITFTWQPSVSTRPAVAGLPAGSYTVTATDKNGCAIKRDFSLTEPDAISPNLSITNVTCNGNADGSVVLTTNGGTPGYTYAWSNADGAPANSSKLKAGDYVVAITDANSCTIKRNFTISQPAPLTISKASHTDISCNGAATGSATVEVSGGTPGYTYSWAPRGGTNATAANLTAGNYTVTVTDTHGCTITKDFIIGQPATPLTLVGASTSGASCYGGSDGTAFIEATGGVLPYSYTWSAGGSTGQSALNLKGGTYTVTITDANQCSITQDLIVLQPASPLITVAGPVTNASCFGTADGSAAVSASGGSSAFGEYYYLWTPRGGTASTAKGLPAGDYTVTVTDALGCKDKQTFHITAPTEVISTTVAVPAAGTYRSGDILTFTVTYNDVITVTGTPSLSLNLNSGDVTANYTKGSGSKTLTFSYTVTSSDQDLDGIQIGALQLNGATLQNQNGCTANIQLNNIGNTSGLLIQNQFPQSITFNPLPELTYGDADLTLSATATSGLPVTYSSSNNNIATIVNGKIHVLHAGSVDITATQSGSTGFLPAAPVTQTLTIQRLPVTVTATLQAKTYGDADPALEYTYSPTLLNGDVFTGALSRQTGEAVGLYPVALNTLAISDDYTIAFNRRSFVINPALLTATCSNQTICFGNELSIPTITYSGFKNNENETVVKTPPVVTQPSYETSGSYNLVLSGGVADNYTFSYVTGKLTVMDIPTGNISQTALSGGTTAGFQLTAPSGTSYQWSTGESTPAITVRTPGTYTVHVSNAAGCSADFVLPVAIQTLSIPNTFSPNGDGINDYWTIPGLQQYPDAKVVVVNRDGQVVFESNHFTRWDGRRGNGEAMPAGVYFYQVRTSASTAPVTGWLNLVR